jgi:hypothetical protein
MAMKYIPRIFLSGIILATVAFNPIDLPSCGPFFPEPVFTEFRAPNYPDYFRGKLGVLQPTFTHRSLFVAYRYLSGQPLSEKEIESLTAPSNATSEPESTWTGSFFATPAMKKWLEARSRIPEIGPTPEIQNHRNDTGKSGNEWRYFLNCTEDAFNTAAHTLNERIELLGAGDPGIKSWGTAQDIVFSNCSKGESIPSAAEPGLPQVFKYDRTYQIAAAHFYAEHYDVAAEMFRAIASDRASPWSPIAPYLAVRCLLRKATVPQKYGEYDRNALIEAEKGLQAVQQDRDRAPLHALARKLEAYADLRLNPLDHIHALTEKLRKQTTDGSFGQDLTDYLYLLDHLNYSRREDLRQVSDMTSWILIMPSNDAADSLKRWKATNNTAWLLAGMIRLRATDPNLPDVMDAAAKMPRSSPAYPTAQYHRIRLMMEANRMDEARNTLDELLTELRTSLENSSLNLFLAQRMQLARNFSGFLEFAPRILQTIRAEDSDPRLEGQSRLSNALFDSDSTRILNRALPLSILSRAALSKLPPALHEQVLRAAWTRAVLISDTAVARNLSGEMVHVFPELKRDLKSWLTAKDEESRQFALAMLLMHFPGMSPYLESGIPRRDKLDGIDALRENWWCGFSAGDLDEPTGNRYNLSRYQKDIKQPVPAEFPSFLSNYDRTEFLQEWKKLAALPTAPNYFGKSVISWAEKHPEDERVPEALYLVVKSTRFGCTDSESGGYSQRAFRLLRSRYPNSEWAKSTPYWFK